MERKKEKDKYLKRWYRLDILKLAIDAIVVKKEPAVLLEAK